YLVQTAWVNGRSRYVKQRYLGKAEDIGKLLEQSTAPLPSHTLNFEFGGTAALYSIAQQLRLVEIIDQHLPKRNQGLSVGQYALLAILNRCLAPTSKLAQRGKNKARRIDLRQVSLGLLVSRDFHLPLFHEIYPGNRPDAVEFRQVLKKLRRRYAEVFPEPLNITLVFDKGNNSRE